TRRMPASSRRRTRARTVASETEDARAISRKGRLPSVCRKPRIARSRSSSAASGVIEAATVLHASEPSERAHDLAAVGAADPHVARAAAWPPGDDDDDGAAAKRDIPLSREWSVTGTSVSAFAGFDHTMQTFMQANGVRAAQLAIAKNGVTKFSRAYT